MVESIGYLCLVLHSHLPFIRHPECNDFLEEDWLFEAMTESYLPLIKVFDNLIEDKIDFKLTMSFSPTLCTMLNDPLLNERYLRYLYKLIELTNKELIRLKDNKEFCNTALMYNNKLKEIKIIYKQKYKGKILKAFKRYQDLGYIEIITTSATHGFLPFMINENSVKAQIKIACEDYKSNFGRNPKGIWLPECAYTKEQDEILKECNLEYFFIDNHAIMNGNPRPKYGVYAPVCSTNGIYAFGRDKESSREVWSKDSGYPGDYRYREFYRDVGYDLDYDYIKPYLHSDGVRRFVGLKYYKITGEVGLGKKKPYLMTDAHDAIDTHVNDFIEKRITQCEYFYELLSRKPLIVSPYDTELFGHWWYEGPEFLDLLFRKINNEKSKISLITPSEYIRKYPESQKQSLENSSWGYKGYYEYWLNDTNDWIYRHLHEMEDCIEKVLNMELSQTNLCKRALKQLSRELLLAQSSDWTFILSSKTATEYANTRLKSHINRFFKLYNDIINDSIDEDWLADIEEKDNIFENIDYKVYL